MRVGIIKTVFKNISITLFEGYHNSVKYNSTLGRWNIRDNSDIKATLANMDCCGGELCGDPSSYSKSIENILKNQKDVKIE